MLDRQSQKNSGTDNGAEQQDDERTSGERGRIDPDRGANPSEPLTGEQGERSAKAPPVVEEDALVESAVSELQKIGNDLGVAEDERQERLAVFLARVYMASMAAKRDSDRHDSLLVKSGIKVQTNTPHHKQTLRAILTLATTKLVKQTEHECYLVLDGLEESRVAENEGSVLAFLKETVEIKGKQVKGFARAKAARAASKKLQDERNKNRSKANAENEAMLQALVTAGEQNRLGVLKIADDDVKLEAGVWLSVNRGHAVLMALEVSPDQLKSVVLKYTNNK